MNPNTTIRTWLLACGKQYGINHAFDLHWPDADARKKEMYFIYKMVSSINIQDGTQDMSTKTENDVLRKAAQKWLTTVKIHLHNSEDGLFELASCVVGLQSDPNIIAIFDGQASFKEVIDCRSLTKKTDEETTYEHKLICNFEEDITIELNDKDAQITKTELQLASDYPNYSIDQNGVTVIPT